MKNLRNCLLGFGKQVQGRPQIYLLISGGLGAKTLKPNPSVVMLLE